MRPLVKKWALCMPLIGLTCISCIMLTLRLHQCPLDVLRHQKTNNQLLPTCVALGDYVVISHYSQMPSAADIMSGNVCLPRHPRLLIPALVEFPSRSGNGIIFDAFFENSTTLVFTSFTHPEDVSVSDIEVVVNGKPVTRAYDHSKWKPNARKFYYFLKHPVSENNTVKISIQTYKKTLKNLPILTNPALRRNYAVHGTVFLYDADLLYLTYEHYTRQGFSHFFWFYNGDVFLDNLIQYVPRHANVLVVAYNIKFMQDGQQGLIPFLTSIYSHILWVAEWFFTPTWTNMSPHCQVHGFSMLPSSSTATQAQGMLGILHRTYTPKLCLSGRCGCVTTGTVMLILVTI